MTQPTPARKTAQKASAPRCAVCSRKLIRPGTVVPGVGVVGPECEKNVAERLTHLYAAGLGELVLQGELRFSMLRVSEGVYDIPQEAISQYIVFANRVGLKLTYQVQVQEYVLGVNAKSLQAFLRLTKGVQA